MRLKKLLALATASALAVTMLAACSSGSNTSAGTTSDSNAGTSTSTPAPSGDKVTLQLGFENSLSEPVGQAAEKWAELVAEKSNGTMELVLYPDSQLGDKSELIDSMLLGEPVCTLADGAFYADYGVPDFGIVFGPFLFDNWEQCWTLIESDWYKEQCAQLEASSFRPLSSS